MENIPQHLCRIALVVCAVVGSTFVIAKDVPQPPDNDILKQRIYLSQTSLVEAASDIAGDTYLLAIQMEARKPINKAKSVEFSVGSKHYRLPGTLFRSEYAISATTHLFQVDNDHVAFVLFCGDGERAKRCLFRIDIRKLSVRREIWTPFGKLESINDDQPMERVKG
jgi:hypothetical protein